MSQKPGLSGIPRKDLTWTRTPLEGLTLDGLRVAIVGGTGGLGRSLALSLASRGANVTVVGQTFRDSAVARIDFMKADLSLMSEARRVGRTLPAEALDLVVLTTGIFAGPVRQETAEGVEKDLAVSYLSRFVIMSELGAHLGSRRGSGAATRARIFVMGFPGVGEKGDPSDLNATKVYKAMPVHMTTVAANEALVLDAVTRYPGIDVFGLNPGLVKTNIRANVLGGEGSWKQKAVEFMIGLFTMSAEKYGARTAPLLVSSDVNGRSGAMFNQKRPIRTVPSRSHAGSSRPMSV